MANVANRETIWIEILLLTFVFSLIFITLITSDTRQVTYIITTAILGFLGLITYSFNGDIVSGKPINYFTMVFPFILLIGLAIGNTIVDMHHYNRLKSKEQDLMKHDRKYRELKITGDVFFLIMLILISTFYYDDNLNSMATYFGGKNDIRYTISFVIIVLLYIGIWISSVVILDKKNKRLNNLTDETIDDTVETSTNTRTTGGPIGLEFPNHTHSY